MKQQIAIYLRLSLEDVDGALIGGASLKVDDFIAIAKNSGAC